MTLYLVYKIWYKTRFISKNWIFITFYCTNYNYQDVMTCNFDYLFQFYKYF